MIDLLIFIMLCLFIQIAIMRIWLNSHLFSWFQDKLTFWRETKTGIIHYIAYLLTCWQCLGVWVSWGVVFPMAIWLPSSPVNINKPVLLIALGLGVALISEILEYYFLVGMDTPIKRSYDLDLDLDADETVPQDDGESVINNESSEEESKDE